MVRKKLDPRVRELLTRSIINHQRSLIMMVGDHGKDQIPNLYDLLSKTSANVKTRHDVLWCYKKDLGFSTHRKKRMKKIKRDKSRGLLSTPATPSSTSTSSVDTFELFLSTTNITWCYYKDSHRVLGQTYSLLILSDFEALTPNILARTIETIEGGGIVVFLLRTVSSLKQLYTMSMDVHARYRTQSGGEVIPRFNERFILSLGKCENCLVCDDEWNILPLSKAALKSLGEMRENGGDEDDNTTVEVSRRGTKNDAELSALKAELKEVPHVGNIVELARTLDQAKAVLQFLEACSERRKGGTLALTAARGRGKSAAIGLCLAGAISFGYSTIFVTAPEPENLVSVFEFVILGLKALKYQDHLDYRIIYNAAKGRDENKCVMGIEIHRGHRQIIKYLSPNEPDKFSSAELVAIDEAAAIPLPTVRALLSKDCLTFLSSTVNGYEGTGRALSLKLIKELRDAKGQTAATEIQQAADAIPGAKIKKGAAQTHEKRWAAAAEASKNRDSNGSPSLIEMELHTPIRYSQNDPVESWLHSLLCLDCASPQNLKIANGAPSPNECELYSVNRDALFSYHSLSEKFLQKAMALYTAAHYKNSPNDLQMLSDAPAHQVFVLLGPNVDGGDGDALPDILCVIQVALEGKISQKVVQAQLARGHRSAGDLIPWTIAQQFGDANFAKLSGARVVRVAVHPNLQSMGYGTRAVDLLKRFYNGDLLGLDREINDTSSEELEEDDDDEEKGEKEETKQKVKGLRGEKITPKTKDLPPLLQPLSAMTPPLLDWLGTSFGLTPSLHRFWNKRAGMSILYLRQTTHQLTGENSAIYITSLSNGNSGYDDAWLPAFHRDCQRRIMSLLGGSFRAMDVTLAYDLLLHENNNIETALPAQITAQEIHSHYLTPHDLKRLDLYSRNLCDYHLITDLLTTMARLYFSKKLQEGLNLSSVQSAILCGMGLQFKSVETLHQELKRLPMNQILAMFQKTVKKITLSINRIVEDSLTGGKDASGEMKNAEIMVKRMRHVAEKTLEEDVREGFKNTGLNGLDVEEGQTGKNSLPAEIIKDPEIMQFAVKGSDEQWEEALKNNTVDGEPVPKVKIKSAAKEKKRKDPALDFDADEFAGKGKKKKTKKSKSKRG